MLRAQKEKTNEIGNFLSAELEHTEHVMKQVSTEIHGVSNLTDSFEKVLQTLVRKALNALENRIYDLNDFEKLLPA